MSKKFLTIFSSLILVGMLSISCSNADKTGSDDSSGTGGSTVDTSKGIEQYNGNIYESSTVTMDSGTGYLWVFIKDGKVSFPANENNTTIPTPESKSYIPVTGSGTDYDFSYGEGNYVITGTLKFSSDGSSVTLRFTKYGPDTKIINKDIVCNKK